MRLPKLHPVARWRHHLRVAAKCKMEGQPEYDYDRALALQNAERAVRAWRRENIRAV